MIKQNIPFYHSLRFRLSLAVALIVFCSVMVTAGVTEWRTFERAIESKQTLLAAAASAHAAAIADPVAEGDQRAALMNLRGIRELPGIRQIDIQLLDGRTFAQLGTGAVLARHTGASSEMSAAEIWSARYVRIELPIVKGGEQIAQLGMLADVSDLRVAVYQSLRATVLVAVVSIGVALLLSQLLISRMTRPLRQLTAGMSSFADDRAADLDVIEAGNDETGVLATTFNTMINAIRSRDQQIAHHVDTLEDTVEQRTAQLRDARDDAEAANAAKSDFLATMSHEIRTPMNGMLVMAEMLSSADLSTRHRRYADIIARSGQSLLTIINDILDLSKIESGNLTLEETPVSPDALVMDVASLFWERAREKQLELATYIAPDVPPQIIADPTRLNQIITNLVNNALKFTQTGGVEIRVTAAPCATAGRTQLTIDVQDTGIGIPADKVDTIFEAFSQADQSTTRRFGGTGLGLAVCRRLATAMGGDVSVRSTVDVGSVFSMSFEVEIGEPAPAIKPAGLPVGLLCGEGLQDDAIARSLGDFGCETSDDAPAFIIATSALADRAPAGVPVVLLSDIGDVAADDLLRDGRAVDLLANPFQRAELGALLARARENAFRGIAAIDANSAAPTRPSFAGLRVLVAEDNAVNREVLREALSTLKVSVDFAVNGAEAVEKAKTGDHTLIFMDGSMPVLDGLSATRMIREWETETGAARMPIHALTAQIADRDKSAWIEAGADGYVTKPFTLDRLIAVFESLGVQASPAPGDDANEAEIARPVELIDAETISGMTQLAGGAGFQLRDRVWDMFKANAAENVGQLHTMAAQKAEGEEISRQAHALKSMSLSAGAAKFATACADIEVAAKIESRKGEVSDLIRTAGLTLVDTLAEMQRQQGADTHAAMPVQANRA